MAENNDDDPNLDKWIKKKNEKKNVSKRSNNKKNLDIKALENWLWEAACKIRGDVDAPKYKDYILPLIFMKRLSDVFEDELNLLIKEYSGIEIVEQLLKEDHSLVRFYIPKEVRWTVISKNSSEIGENLTDCVRSISKENPKLQGVIDIVDFNATTAGQRIINDDKLSLLVDILGRYRLGINDVEPDIFGRAYEYLLRKFAEGSGQSAGEFYTPREVAILISHLVNPEPGQEIYDPCCGSGGLLIKTFLNFDNKYGNKTSTIPLSFYGQEILPSSFAMAKMNSFIHDMEAKIALGDTMNNPAFKISDGSIQKFDIVIANPMWRQDFPQSLYENDPHDRFQFGYPPSNSADWGWIQHMFKSLKDNGKVAVVIDTGAVSRGSGNQGTNRERDIRKEILKQGLIEAIILLPENMFYNTNAPGAIVLINKKKEHKDEILVINASKLFEKGRPKNFLPDLSILQISEIYYNWKEVDGISKIITREEVIKNDYNLSPSRYVAQNGTDDTIPLEDALILLKEAEEEQKQAKQELNKVLHDLGFEL